MPRKVCSAPDCPDVPIGAYCPLHTSERERNRNAGRVDRLKVYSSKKWKTTRKHVLFEQPLCPNPTDNPNCTKLSHHVHHIQDMADGGEKYARANLLGLCHSCHSVETRSHRTQTMRGG